MTYAATAPRVHRTPGAIVLGIVLVALGIESTLQMITDWTLDGRLTVATGILLLVGGAGVIVGSPRALRTAAWAVRAQLALTVILASLAFWLQVETASRTGLLPLGPLLGLAAAATIHVAACVVALAWIRRARDAIAPTGPASGAGDGSPG